MSHLPLHFTYLLKKIRPRSKYKIRNNTYAGIEWRDKKTSKPTIEEFEAAFLHFHHNPPVKKTVWQKIKAFFSRKS
jgi:hypothetical protein